MLKRIRTEQVELGMFIHRLDGNWFLHPFWKAGFLLNDDGRLERLQSSAVTTVVIDASRGRDVPAPRAAQSAQSPQRSVAGAEPPRAQPPRTQTTAMRALRKSVELTPEMARAERIARQTGKAVNRMFVEARLGKHLAASNVEPVIEDIYASIQRNIYAFNGLLRCQSDQLHLYRHALAVSALMIALARRMNLSPGLTRQAGMVGLLMDIGMAPISAEADVADYRNLPDHIAQGHVLQGQTVLRAAGDIPKAVLDACLQHHERLDGTGYPQGQSGADIGQFARMAAVCDIFDDLVSGSNQTRPVDPAHALDMIRKLPECYDGTILERLIEAVGAYPIGSFVLLKSAQLAMVVDQDAADIALPVVRIFATIATERGTSIARMVPPVTLALGHCYGEDAIDSVADLAAFDLVVPENLRAVLLAGASRDAAR